MEFSSLVIFVFAGLALNSHSVLTEPIARHRTLFSSSPPPLVRMRGA